jgi:small subunit ribosomal protein S12
MLTRYLAPQRKAVCLKVLTKSPKKPNSANRKVAKVRVIKNSQELTIKVPGEGSSLQTFSIVLVRGKGVRDLIGVSYSAIRGCYDLLGVKNRRSSRSRYGVKRNV